MARILDVKGRRVWDSRGRATVEAEVIVGRGTTPLAAGRAIAPAGASTGSGEARALDAPTAGENIKSGVRDGGRAPGGAGPAGGGARPGGLRGAPGKNPPAAQTP